MRSGPISEPTQTGSVLSLFLVSGFCLAWLGTAGAQEPSPAPDSSPVSVAQQKAVFEAIEDEVADIFGKCKGAVVRIEASDPLEQRNGTGFFIDPSGTIYTSYTVAGNALNVTVEYANKKYLARCLVADPVSGVMILKIDGAGQTPFLPLGKSEELRVASPVVGIGYPKDSPASPTFGLVAGFDQKCPGGFLPLVHIRANMPVRPGQAGMPVLNEHGVVVGMLAYHLDFGAVCLVLPIKAAEQVRTDYVRFGHISPGWIGMTAVPADGDIERDPVKVTAVVEDAPASRSGLQEGDIIAKFGRTPIRCLLDLCDATFFLSAYDKVPVTVLRGGKEVTIEIRAANPPGLSPVPDRDAAEEGSIGTGERLALPTAPVDAGRGRDH